MRHPRRFCFFLALVLSLSVWAAAFALDSSTLHNGSRGEEVRTMQQALIQLGYLKGEADGIFGNRTEKAVRAFQAAKKLQVDGLAGKKTLSLLAEAAASSSGAGSAVSPSSSSSSGVQQSSAESSVSPSSAAVSSAGLFSGNYATLKLNDNNSRVKILQSALIRLNYLSGKDDGVFGRKTLAAVVLFQKENGLSADGLAGKKTLRALENAVAGGLVRGSSVPGESSGASSPSSSASSGETSSYTPSLQTGKAPDGSTIYLLHWFNDVKPSLKNGEKLLIYDPSTGISWTLRVHSRGRHCDAEPLTKQDTENMVKAFGGVNTWDQKGVYVKLPSGVWTIGSTHDMPHMSGTISDNGFNGHLCVHFLRDMAEAEQNDPNYGVANQKTIRALWKSLTGEELDY